jgi:hypothetical protein
MQTPIVKKFIQWHAKQTKPVLEPSIKKANNELAIVEGFIEDVNKKQGEIETDITDNVLLKDERIQKIDLALESIMNNEWSGY